jgi:hypothetical protein
MMRMVRRRDAMSIAMAATESAGVWERRSAIEVPVRIMTRMRMITVG